MYYRMYELVFADITVCMYKCTTYSKLTCNVAEIIDDKWREKIKKKKLEQNRTEETNKKFSFFSRKGAKIDKKKCTYIESKRN